MKEHEEVTTVEGALRLKLRQEAEIEVGQLFEEFDNRVRELLESKHHKLDRLQILNDQKKELGYADQLLRQFMVAVINELVEKRFSVALRELVTGKTQAVHVEGRAEARRTPRRAQLWYRVKEDGSLDGMRVVALEDIHASEEVCLVPSLFIERGQEA